MKSILALIESKQKVYAQSPLFHFMKDQSIDPVKRLAFAPCAVPFIMGFSDLCKYSLRQEPTNDKIQMILNQHTYEDDFHWQWFIKDLETLGFNCSLSLNDAIQFLWSDQTKVSRLLTHELHSLIIHAEAVDKLIIMEAMESTADVLLSTTKQITEELKLITHQKYEYFGSSHCDAEHDHNTNSKDARQFIKDIQIPLPARENSISLVEKVFELFTEWTNELLSFAQNHQVSQPFEQQLERDFILNAA
ncbi:MAG: hypothetical protein KME09_15910 [Pleurocapsa minor HA4230-MV1]|jgi:hypothetical protein|nr:hypothetical protein [Pleurocapsa minor HA4230-MV1]